MLLRILACILVLMFVAAAVPSQAEAGWQRLLAQGLAWLGGVIVGHEVTEQWKEMTDDDDSGSGCYDTCSCSPTGSCHSGCDCTGSTPSDPQTYGDGAHNHYGSMYGSNYGSQYGSY